MGKYPDSKKDVCRFYLINIHPAGELEAFMTRWAELTAPFVIKVSA
jgi:hypothetical protein